MTTKEQENLTRQKQQFSLNIPEILLIFGRTKKIMT